MLNSRNCTLWTSGADELKFRIYAVILEKWKGGDMSLV